MDSPPKGADGTCGWQYNNATCIPQQGRSCCSINGFCGSNETYCLISNGCQSGCVDPTVFHQPSASAPTTIATASATPTPASSLTSQQKTGIIVGVILFFFFITAGVLFWLYKRRSQRVRLSQTGPNGVTRSIEIPQLLASEHPQIVGNGGIFPRDGYPVVGSPPTRLQLGAPSFMGGRADTNAQYANDADDFRFRDVSSEDHV